MDDQTRTIHRDTDEARGGSTTGTVRWVLGISLLAAIVLLSAIWMFGAFSHDGEERQANINNMQTAEQRDAASAEPAPSSPSQ